MFVSQWAIHMWASAHNRKRNDFKFKFQHHIEFHWCVRRSIDRVSSLIYIGYKINMQTIAHVINLKTECLAWIDACKHLSWTPFWMTETLTTNFFSCEMIKCSSLTSSWMVKMELQHWKRAHTAFDKSRISSHCIESVAQMEMKTKFNAL